jgi:hypothetical protein
MKEQAKKNKAIYTAIMVIVGAHLLEMIKQHGPCEINRFNKVDELHALLVKAYPQGVIPKPRKKGSRQ